MTQYRVTAPCVTHIPVAAQGGSMLSTFYQDAVLPPGIPDGRIKHLLDSGLIEAIEEQKAAEPEPTPTGVNSRSSKGDLVEHGVAAGDDRAELEALNREQLLGRYVRQQ